MIWYTSFMLGNNYLLWENEELIVCTPHNPHLPYDEGPIVIVKPKQDITTAWQDPKLTGRFFELAAIVCQVMEELKMAPWFNLQANGNWGLLSEAKPFFHIYIYGRNKTDRWAKPIVLPDSPKTYKNDSMPENDRQKLSTALNKAFM